MCPHFAPLESWLLNGPPPDGACQRSFPRRYGCSLSSRCLSNGRRRVCVSRGRSFDHFDQLSINSRSGIAVTKPRSPKSSIMLRTVGWRLVRRWCYGAVYEHSSCLPSCILLTGRYPWTLPMLIYALSPCYYLASVETGNGMAPLESWNLSSQIQRSTWESNSDINRWNCPVVWQAVLLNISKYRLFGKTACHTVVRWRIAQTRCLICLQSVTMGISE